MHLLISLRVASLPLVKYFFFLSQYYLCLRASEKTKERGSNQTVKTDISWHKVLTFRNLLGMFLRMYWTYLTNLQMSGLQKHFFLSMPLKECRGVSTSLFKLPGIHLWPVNFLHERPVMQKMFPCHDGFMCKSQWTMEVLKHLPLNLLYKTHIRR